MRICDLPVEKIVPGIRVKSLISNKQGTIERIDYDDDRYAWILWDGDEKAFNGFYRNDCRCEIID